MANLGIGTHTEYHYIIGFKISIFNIFLNYDMTTVKMSIPELLSKTAFLQQFFQSKSLSE